MSGESGGYDIAVVGMAGRFPGARNLGEFWRNLKNGVESVKFFTDDELLAAGESRAALQDPHYVKAQPVLSGFDEFDAALFGFSPQDAAVMDPQHRIFLEVGWQALENAGHTAAAFAGNIGVFASCGMNSYMMFNLVNNRRIMETVGEWLVRHTGNDMNFLATRLSYLLNLSGPSMNVQTACSSALVAVHLACQSLLSGECDMALAGGSVIALPQNRGYLYKPGEILSPDGHCRPFDANAKGTLFGSGAGVVTLRRLRDAEVDGDQILAIIKGSAINNDGSAKVGYLAPSVEGQAKAITEALTISGVDPETIGYVEMHGTGTIVGDPIEVTALTQAWHQFTDKHGICAIGSVKSNIGHLGEAAGVAAFIKVVLALNHGEIPPSLHYESPNPQIEFSESPFFVGARLTAWPASGGARRAALTALGAGGTNCHMILEKGSSAPASGRSRPWQLLTISALSATALDAATTALAKQLRDNPLLDLADVAYTLKVGRKAFPHRRTIVCRDRADALEALSASDPKRVSARKAQEKASVVFMFPGGGAQYANMGRDLYECEPIYRAVIERCADYLRPTLGIDLRSLMFPSGDVAAASQRMEAPSLALPALFATEFALAKLLLSWGVEPAAMIGHSMGEYVAACLAGVITYEEGLDLVALRGRLFEKVEPGAMLVVPLSEHELRPSLGRDLSIAAINGPMLCVAAGPVGGIDRLRRALTEKQIDTTPVHISVAAHSAMLEPILAEFEAFCRRIPFQEPKLSYISNLTGTWITAAEARDASYWVRHLRQSVQFGAGIQELLRSPDRVLLEIGPGRTLSSLAKQQPAQALAALSTMRHPAEESPDLLFLLNTLGQLWQAGVAIDWKHFYAGEQRARVALSPYPFERQRYWIDPDSASTRAAALSIAAAAPSDVVPKQSLEKLPVIADWFRVPGWKKAPLVARPAAQPLDPNWLVFLDHGSLGEELCAELIRPDLFATETSPKRLDIGTPGEVESLAFVPCDRPAPGPGEVEIRVRCTALNFADVLKATGVFPEAPFGMECAGVVERVGSAVTHLHCGDEVVAIGPESFRSFVTRDARWVALKPRSLSMDEAVTLPAAFMTAWYSLHHVGKLRRGEKVLIHAASGGVGLAAVQVARFLGVEIFATAGSEEKRAFLRSLGIRHVFDSRMRGFGVEIARRTAGQGIDVALNSLTGEFIPETLSSLAAHGRFLEIGKREILSSTQLAALHPADGVTYHPIDLTLLLRNDPDGYGALLREVVEHATAGEFAALSHKVFPAADAARAFQLMLQTKHIGKVVLSLAQESPTIYTVRAGSKFANLGEGRFTIAPDSEADYVALLEALESVDAKIGHIAHLWNVAPAPDPAQPLERQLAISFLSPLWLGKALGHRDWEQALDLSFISTGLHQIAGETSLEPQKATLLGPCRVLPHEMPNISCRSVDIPTTKRGSWRRRRAVETLAAELAAASSERTVAYRGTERWIERYEPAPLSHRPPPIVRAKGVYLITGGLGGLGLALAEHLAQSAKAKLVLIGRRALPERRDWPRWIREHGEADAISDIIRRIEACEAQGGEVITFAADVTNRHQMRAAISEGRRRFGVINGVIHAAGTLDDGLIQLKTQQAALGVIAPKMSGALVLDEILGDAPLDFFILFSSIASVLGLEGQVDYTAANAFLDAFAEFRSARRPGQTVAINWGAWREVGMAARAFGEEPLTPGAATHHPWLDVRRNRGDEEVFATQFSRSRQWVLGEHVIHDGDALIPGTGYLELVRAAFAELDDATAVEIGRVFFEAPFMARPEETKELTIALHRGGERWAFKIQSEAGALTHVTGEIGRAEAAAAPVLDLAAIARRCSDEEKLDGFLKQPFMDFGARWGNVRSIRYSIGEALLSLELPAVFSGDLERITLHPALLDMATGGAQRLLSEEGKQLAFFVPFSYGKLVLRHGFPQKIVSHVERRPGGGPEIATFTVTIADEDGRVLAEIADFVMKKVSPRDLGAAAASHHAAIPAPAGAATALARKIQRAGILPQEGAEALERILATGAMPRIAVSPVSLEAWLRRVEVDSAPKPTPTGAAAGVVKGDGLAGGSAGSSSVERKLAGMYAQILGVTAVGPRDDFFALGGHSLLALRLLARMEKEFGKAVPLPTLFERPTIEGLAAYLQGDKPATPDRPSAIVPLSEGGTGLAFYCVHSVGGDVMGFRHLAKLLGPEQRFYGIQAPPELRNAEFPSSIEAMALYYVETLLEFQPDGPYLLGGWSAGSLIALEIAHQLESRGHEVKLLVALDGAPFNTGAGTRPWNPMYYWKLLRNLPLWIADDLMVDFSLEFLTRRVRNKLISFSRKTKSALRNDAGPQGHEVEGFLDTSYYSSSQVDFMKALFVACRAYRAKPYHGRVLLYAAQTQPLYHLLEVELAWAKIASRLLIVPTRGTHESIVREPHVLAVATDLAGHLTEFRTFGRSLATDEERRFENSDAGMA